MSIDQDRCPTCGRWVDPDADDTYFVSEDPINYDFSPVIPCCSKKCGEAYWNKHYQTEVTA